MEKQNIFKRLHIFNCNMCTDDESAIPQWLTEQASIDGGILCKRKTKKTPQGMIWNSVDVINVHYESLWQSILAYSAMCLYLKITSGFPKLHGSSTSEGTPHSQSADHSNVPWIINDHASENEACTMSCHLTTYKSSSRYKTRSQLLT